MFRYEIKVDEYLVSIYLGENDVRGKNILEEARQKGLISLGGVYSANVHPANILGIKKHIEVFQKNNKLFAMNYDGTGHDGSKGTRIPNKVADAIRNKLSGFYVPDDQIIECVANNPTDLIDEKTGKLIKELLEYFNGR
jgi:hypothetical protein